MKTDTPHPIYLKDYQPPAFLVDTVNLEVNFQPDQTLVAATIQFQRNPAAEDPAAPLQLDGDELETLGLALDGEPLAPGRYQIDDAVLTLPDAPDRFVLTILTRLRPDANTKLSGLYRSADGYFTQCEAQGFRRITWFPDRPDVMARYTVTLHADKQQLPVLLANGNPVASGDEGEGRHWARWVDPFPKPAYLFALVAGRLDVLRDSYRTTSGREVQLAIYVSPGKLDQCDHEIGRASCRERV